MDTEYEKTGAEREPIYFDEGEYEGDSNRPDVLAAIERTADDGPGRDQHGPHGPAYVVDPREMVGRPAPDFGATAAAWQCLGCGATWGGDREAHTHDEREWGPIQPEAEPEPGSPLDTRVQGLIRDRKLGYASRRKTAERIIAAVREADAVPPTADELRTRVRRTIRSRDVGQLTAEEATEAILALVAVFNRRSSHEGATVSDLTAERFGPVGGDR